MRFISECSRQEAHRYTPAMFPLPQGGTEPRARPTTLAAVVASHSSTVPVAQALPSPVSPGVRRIFAANLVAQVAIVVSGGLVRLTGSGLGCPTWPECVEGSLVPVEGQAEALHKYIEFGNRTLTFVLGALAIAAIVGGLRMRARVAGRGGPAAAADPPAGHDPAAGDDGPGAPRRRHRPDRPAPADRRRALPAVGGRHRRLRGPGAPRRRARRRAPRPPGAPGDPCAVPGAGDASA